jgi:hypothetical protein
MALSMMTTASRMLSIVTSNSAAACTSPAATAPATFGVVPEADACPAAVACNASSSASRSEG